MSDVFTLRGPVKKDRPEPAQRSVGASPSTGAVLGTVTLEPSIFGVEPNMAVMHQVIKAQLAAKRSGTQSTKTRKEVRGGGKKPFNQKGTGGARQGTIRAPHYPGGGIALGPKPRSYEQKTPKKMIRLALYSALSDRARLEQRRRRRQLRHVGRAQDQGRDRALEALGLEGKILVVLGATTRPPLRSFRNLMNVKTIDAGELNAYDVLDCDWVVFTDATLPTAEGEEPDARRHEHLDSPGGLGEDLRLDGSGHLRLRRRPAATKIDVRNAVEQAFNVKVTNVNTLNRKGKYDPQPPHRRARAPSPTPSAPSSPCKPVTRSTSSRTKDCHGPSSPQTHESRSPFPDGLGLRRNHDDHAREVAARAQAQDRWTQQLRPQDLASPRRWSQAAVPHHRLQAQQGRHPGEGRDH